MTTTIQLAVFGLGYGAIYCLIVQGMVVTYAGSGVLNLAQAAIVMFGAFFFRQLHILSGWAFFPAALATILACAALGALTYLVVMRQLRLSSALAKVAATLGLLLTLEGACAVI